MTPRAIIHPSPKIKYFIMLHFVRLCNSVPSRASLLFLFFFFFFLKRFSPHARDSPAPRPPRVPPPESPHPPRTCSQAWVAAAPVLPLSACPRRRRRWAPGSRDIRSSIVTPHNYYTPPPPPPPPPPPSPDTVSLPPSRNQRSTDHRAEQTHPTAVEPRRLSLYSSVKCTTQTRYDIE